MGDHLITQAASVSWCAPVLDRELPALALCVAAFCVLFAMAEVARRWLALPIEVTRKGVHVGAGLVTLALPYLFDSLVSLVALALGFAGLMWTTRRLGLLSSVHRIDRRTAGATLYPLGICALVLLSRGRPVLYDVPLLVMVLADPAACLGGMAVGRHPYAVLGQRRTLEGSAAFFATTFIVSALALSLHGRLPFIDGVALAALLAGTLVFVEAWSVDGWDNFTVPVAGYGVVVAGLSLERGVLALAAVQVVLLACVAAGFIAWTARRDRLAVAPVREVES